jgi:hypothetical protein
MEQEFLLKYYGRLSRFEINEMTAEDRSWWLKRLDREAKKTNERTSQA